MCYSNRNTKAGNYSPLHSCREEGTIPNMFSSSSSSPFSFSEDHQAQFIMTEDVFCLYLDTLTCQVQDTYLRDPCKCGISFLYFTPYSTYFTKFWHGLHHLAVVCSYMIVQAFTFCLSGNITLWQKNEALSYHLWYHLKKTCSYLRCVDETIDLSYN